MLSEFLEILGLVSNLPDKKHNNNDDDKVVNLIAFFTVLISAVCIIFIIPEIKKNTILLTSINVIISIFFTFIILKILQRKNMLSSLRLSVFPFVAISIFLVFVLSVFLFIRLLK